MAFIPRGLFGGRSTDQRQVEIKELRADINTRPKNPAGKKEEFQWVLRCTLYTENKGITRLDELGGSIIPTLGREIRGSFRGATDVTVRLDESVWSEFRCVSQGLVGIEATGSEIVSHSQQYVAVSKWYDAPWNDEIGV
jgi:hypothetical protein